MKNNEYAIGEQNNRIFCYLFYGGAVIDIILNYGLIICYTLIIFYPCLMSLQTWKKLVQSIVFIAVQVILWICLDVCGVSLIWSGQLGLIILHLTSICIKKARRHQDGVNSGISTKTNENSDDPEETNYNLKIIVLSIATFFGLCVLVYYAIMLPPITTIAHATAIFIGSIIASIMSFFRNCKNLVKKIR